MTKKLARMLWVIALLILILMPLIYQKFGISEAQQQSAKEALLAAIGYLSAKVFEKKEKKSDG